MTPFLTAALGRDLGAVAEWAAFPGGLMDEGGSADGLRDMGLVVVEGFG